MPALRFVASCSPPLQTAGDCCCSSVSPCTWLLPFTLTLKPAPSLGCWATTPAYDFYLCECRQLLVERCGAPGRESPPQASAALPPLPQHLAGGIRSTSWCERAQLLQATGCTAGLSSLTGSLAASNLTSWISNSAQVTSKKALLSASKLVWSAPGPAFWVEQGHW